MEQKVVRKLEEEIENSFAEIVSRLEPRDLPLLPSQQTMHLMAKRAVAVYESAFRIRQGITANETRKEEPDDAHNRRDDLADL